MSDEQIEKINAYFLALMNDINEYLKDESVPMECYAHDIDHKLDDGRMVLIEMLKYNQ